MNKKKNWTGILEKIGTVKSMHSLIFYINSVPQNVYSY